MLRFQLRKLCFQLREFYRQLVALSFGAYGDSFDDDSLIIQKFNHAALHAVYIHGISVVFLLTILRRAIIYIAFNLKECSVFA